jgi:hypothetical protein
MKTNIYIAFLIIEVPIVVTLIYLTLKIIRKKYIMFLCSYWLIEIILLSIGIFYSLTHSPDSYNFDIINIILQIILFLLIFGYIFFIYYIRQNKIYDIILFYEEK